MLKVKSRIAASVIAMGAMLASGQAQAEEIIAALIGPLETAQGQGFEFFGERLSELTNGELTVKIFPDGQLGGNTEVFEQLIGGQVDIAALPPGEMAEFVPELQVLSTPFLFRDFDHWKAVSDGEIGQELADLTAERSDVMILGYFGGSVRNLVAKPEVSDATNLGGLKMRLHPSPLLVAAWEAIGATPSVVAYNEIYNALQLGVIDGLENEPEWVLRMKFYEQAKNYVLTEHEIVTRPLVFSKLRFDGLSPEHQEAVAQAAREAAQHQREIEHDFDAKSRAELAEQHGMNLVDADRDAIRAKVSEAIAPVLVELGLDGFATKISAQ
ncbi:TRAP transporter substrate-binding protein [Paracoccus sp. M683]|uniref:TRAP transporter substrate-binding protein n=1 Tax=Paracoccus sp. M683 TaxID=2594268 RepID=UPI00117FED00|nr:TRAP transporter substrate-binding protein [Paracoccus sp. M683]TRW99252.1 TRAP transporter substrate-binding protein [Paracoccus sp. M683]